MEKRSEKNVFMPKQREKKINRFRFTSSNKPAKNAAYQ